MRLNNNKSIGAGAEDLAANFLRKLGYSIIAKNFRTKIGELDIIAKDKHTICFIEVKCRSNLSCGLPQEAITDFKRHNISRTALFYLKKNKLLDVDARFDVVGINLDEGKCELFKNAFELDSRYSY